MRFEDFGDNCEFLKADGIERKASERRRRLASAHLAEASANLRRSAVGKQHFKLDHSFTGCARTLLLITGALFCPPRTAMSYFNNP